MRLAAPSLAPKLHLKDIHGNVIDVANGKRTLLAFFRDAACPFCNMQVYHLTQRHEELAALGLQVVAVFASTPEEVKRFVLTRPRPFPVAAEPDRQAYEIYGLQSSRSGKIRAIFKRFFTLVRGLFMVGLAGLKTNNIMPADFLIDEEGRIAEAYYGEDAGDHIPFERVELFLAKGLVKQKRAEMEVGKQAP